MSQKEQNEMSMEVEKPNNSRREFLVKASAGAVIATLPAKAVWATGTAGSITASGHSSDFAQSNTIKLKDSHYWLNNSSRYPQMEQFYSAITGGIEPRLWGKIKKLLKWQLSKVRLCHLMGATNAVKNLLEDIYSSEIAAGNSPIYQDSNGVTRVKWNHNGSNHDKTLATVVTWMKGSDKVNELVATTYLSAFYSSQSPHAAIYYPVLTTNINGRNPYGKITSDSILLQKLHHAAKTNRHAFMSEFSALTS